MQLNIYRVFFMLSPKERDVNHVVVSCCLVGHEGEVVYWSVAKEMSSLILCEFWRTFYFC